ncbi:MAG: DUF364 domain-containing protein [Caldisericota bacterium]|nr:DUF364 domain-containing protein [Caldisericota bacterium]
MAVYDILTMEFERIAKENNLLNESVVIKAAPLTAEEAIGDPTDKDYPIIKGQEKLMEAHFRGARGQAFTDFYGNFTGTIQDVLDLDLRTNYQRAIFVSTLNAILDYLKLTDKTIHCKNDEPRECAENAVDFIKRKFGNPKIFLIGYQPRFAETFSKHFHLRIVDLDNEMVGKKVNGVLIEVEESTSRNIEWADLLWITGTTVVNNTIEQFLNVKKDKVFYGTTIAGAAYILNLKRFCSLAK